MNDQKRRFEGQNDIYQEVGYLGGGQTADVYRVRRQTDNSEWALKLLRASEYQARFFNEVDTLLLLDDKLKIDRTDFQANVHPLVPKVIDSQRTGKDQFFVMTLAQGQPLDEVLRERGALTEHNGLYILSQVTRVFRVLHEQLERSYLDFQPRNVFWHEATRQVIVVDWNLLSRKGEIDAPSDILTLGKLLYRMVVGMPLPAAGITAAPNWANVTLGTQQILRQATHSSLAQRYRQVAELQVACESQWELWEKPAYGLLSEATTLLAETTSTEAQAEKDTVQTEENRRRFARARNLMQILEQRPGELSDNSRPTFLAIQGKIQAGWQASTLFATGQRFLNVPDLEQAQKCFAQLYAESDDLDEKLQAIRWQLVAQTADAHSRRVIRETCALLDDHRLDTALVTLNNAMPAKENTPLAKLRHDIEAQRAWQEAEELTTQAGKERSHTLYEEAAAKLAEVQAHIAQLSESHRRLLTELWGDPQQKQANLTQQAQALVARSTNLDTLRKELSGRSRPEIVNRLKKALEQQPGAPELVRLGLDEARAWLVKLSTTPHVADLVKDVQNLLDVALIHTSPQVRPALLAEWRTAATLQQILHLLERPLVDIQHIEQQLATLVADESSITWTEALRYLSEQMMQRAERDLDLTLGQLAAATAQGARFVTTAALRERVVKVQQAVQDKVVDRRQRIHDRIKQLAGENSAADITEALSLIQWQLNNDESDPERSGLEEQRRLLEERKAAQQSRQEANVKSEVFNTEFRKLKESATYTDAPQQLNKVAEDLIALGRMAREQHLDVIAEQCDSEALQIHAHSENLTQMQLLLDKATEIFKEYERLPKALSDLRAARIYTLLAVRQKLNETDQLAVKTIALDELRRQVDDAWTNENGDLDLINPDSPLSALQKLEQLDTVRQKIEQLPNQQTVENVQRRIDTVWARLQGWNRILWLLLVTLFLLILVGLGLGWLQLRISAANGQEAALNELANRLSGRIEDVGNLVSGAFGGIATPVSTLAGQVAAVATQVNGVTAPINALSDQVTTLAGRLNGLETLLIDLPGQVAQLANQVNAVGNAVDKLNNRLVASTPAANLIPTPDVVATEQASAATLEALYVPINATATAQTSFASNLVVTEQALTTRLAELDSRATALAATPAAPAAQAMPSVTPTSSLTSTTTSSFTTAATNGAITITFPVSGTKFYIAPWVVEVRARSWLTEVTRYQLRLNDALLAIFLPVVDGDTYTYRRNITSDFDDFPNISPEDRAKLSLNEHNQLPPGPYTLRLEVVMNGGQIIELGQVDFVIRNNNEAIVAFNNRSDPLVRRREPRADEQSRLDNQSLGQGANAHILGKTLAPFNNVKTLWCYWEAVDIPRRGWTLCEYLTTTTGQPAEQLTDGFPELMPPQP